jgi:hypothetical protein
VSSWRRKSLAATADIEPDPVRHDATSGWRNRAIYVTRPGYDDIGAVLTSMGVHFEPFKRRYDCDLLFVNCRMRNRLDPTAVRRFVETGVCLNACMPPTGPAV